MRFLGVRAEDEEAYRSLLRRRGFGEARLTDLAANDGNIAQNTRESYRQLIDLGLATEGPEGSTAPVSPAKALERLVEDKVRQLRRKLENKVATSGIVDSLLAEQEWSMG